MNTSKLNNFALEIFQGIKYPEKIFCVDSKGQSIKYKDLQERTRQLAHGLKTIHNIGPGSRVAIAIDDSVHWPVLFLALILLGANPILLFSNMVGTDIDKIISTTDADLLITDTEDFVFKTYIELEGCHNWEDNVPCWWGLSSGGTGRHKIIVHNHGSFKKLYELANEQIKVTSRDVILCTAKMAFPYGLAQMFWALRNNATLCLITKTPAPSLIFRMIKKHNVTRLNVGPYLLNAMCDCRNRHMLDQVKVVCSGEYLSESLREKVLEQLGCKVYDTYGATEVWTTISIQNNPDTKDMGEILPQIDYKLVDGELYIKHPVQAMMYWKDVQANQKTFRDGWVATGDIVEVKDNRIRFLGRKDDMIKIKGTFVSMLDLEDTINKCEHVEESLVSVDHSGPVAETYALVKYRNNHDRLPELRRYLKDVLPSDKIPMKIKKVDKLPRTVNNKLKRHVGID